jgi:hypothetical protein
MPRGYQVSTLIALDCCIAMRRRERGLVWVKVRHRGLSELSPLLPQHRTLASLTVMSQLCQLRTHAMQQKARHSITSSARATKVGGMVIPTAFAVFRLMTSSNLVGCTIGRFAGFSPFNTRPA